MRGPPPAPSPQHLKPLHADLEDLSGRTALVTGGLRHRGGDRVAARFRRCERHLVNNAALSLSGTADSLAVEDFDALFATNVRGPFFLVAAFAPAMARRGGGSSINIPLNRVADPGEIAELVVFLASSRASYATGGRFPVDGGRTAA